MTPLPKIKFYIVISMYYLYGMFFAMVSGNSAGKIFPLAGAKQLRKSVSALAGVCLQISAAG
jgi:hypothetical protein